LSLEQSLFFLHFGVWVELFKIAKPESQAKLSYQKLKPVDAL